jgi:hypothetical protein
VFRCDQAVPETVERYRDWAVAEGHDLEAVIAEAAPEAALADEAVADALGELRAADGVTIHGPTAPSRRCWDGSTASRPSRRSTYR